MHTYTCTDTQALHKRQTTHTTITFSQDCSCCTVVLCKFLKNDVEVETWHSGCLLQHCIPHTLSFTVLSMHLPCRWPRSVFCHISTSLRNTHLVFWRAFYAWDDHQLGWLPEGVPYLFSSCLFPQMILYSYWEIQKMHRYMQMWKLKKIKAKKFSISRRCER